MHRISFLCKKRKFIFFSPKKQLSPLWKEAHCSFFWKKENIFLKEKQLFPSRRKHTVPSVTVFPPSSFVKIVTINICTKYEDCPNKYQDIWGYFAQNAFSEFFLFSGDLVFPILAQNSMFCLSEYQYDDNIGLCSNDWFWKQRSVFF